MTLFFVLAGLLAATVPPLGLTLIGASIPEPVRRRFNGCILLVVDADEDVQDAVAPHLANIDVVPLDDQVADAG
jgi:hypothetical protein